jgi:hypothetical protein
LVTSSYILFHAVYFKGIWEGMKKSTTSCRTMRTYGSESVKCTAISLFLTLHCVYVHLCPTSSLLNFNSACRRAGEVNIFLPKQRYMRVQFAAYMWAVRLIMEVFLSSAISVLFPDMVYDGGGHCNGEVREDKRHFQTNTSRRAPVLQCIIASAFKQLHLAFLW